LLFTLKLNWTLILSKLDIATTMKNWSLSIMLPHWKITP
jgi:hypothetical protein